MRFSIASTPIDCAALNRSMRNGAAGAFVSFEGWVRDASDGHAVTALDYEVFHALALAEGAAVLAEAIARFGLLDACAVHREGALAIGDCAVWIGVTARHRAEAFDACRAIIDAIKQRLPVWKKEHYERLEPVWINCQAAPARPSVTADDFYARQMILPEIAAAGQEKLGQAKILIVGAGGLGAAAALALAGAGVGTIGLADPDRLEASNLHRQTLYNAADIGQPKAMLAAARLRALNPLIGIVPHETRLTAENAGSLFSHYDIVLDCTDNFTAKYLLSDAAVLFEKPVVQASIYRFEGQLMTIDGGDEAGCLRCLFPQPPLAGTVGNCAETGVLGTVPALFGALQANAAVRRVLGLPPTDGLFMFDLLSLRSRTIRRDRNPDCPVCGARPTIRGLTMPDTADIDVIVQPSDTAADLRRRYRFIDVRETPELQQSPVADALHMPSTAFDPSALDAAKDAPLLLICAKGGRSRAAAEYLRGQGWSRAYNLVGGFSSLPEYRDAVKGGRG